MVSARRIPVLVSVGGKNPWQAHLLVEKLGWRKADGNEMTKFLESNPGARSIRLIWPKACKDNESRFDVLSPIYEWSYRFRGEGEVRSELAVAQYSKVQEGIFVLAFAKPAVKKPNKPKCSKTGLRYDNDALAAMDRRAKGRS